MASTDQLVTRIKYRVSRQDDSSINTRIIDELAAAQESLECGTTLPWFLNVQAALNVLGAHDTFSLLSFDRFLRIAEDDFALRVENLTIADGEPLVKLTRQDTYEKLIENSTGMADAATFPDSYCVLGHTVHVRKKQVVDRTYHLSYFKQDVDVPATGVTTLWTRYLPELIMAEAGINIARYLRDKEALQIFTSLRGVKYAEFVRRNQALQDADENYVMDE